MANHVTQEYLLIVQTAVLTSCDSSVYTGFWNCIYNLTSKIKKVFY